LCGLNDTPRDLSDRGVISPATSAHLGKVSAATDRCHGVPLAQGVVLPGVVAHDTLQVGDVGDARLVPPEDGGAGCHLQTSAQTLHGQQLQG